MNGFIIKSDFRYLLDLTMYIYLRIQTRFLIHLNVERGPSKGDLNFKFILLDKDNAR